MVGAASKRRPLAVPQGSSMDYARRPHSMDGFLDDVKGFLSDVQGVGTKFQAAQQAWQSPSPTATQSQNTAILNNLFSSQAPRPAVQPAAPTFFTPTVKKYLMWGGIGLGGLLLVLVVAKAVQK